MLVKFFVVLLLAPGGFPPLSPGPPPPPPPPPQPCQERFLSRRGSQNLQSRLCNRYLRSQLMTTTGTTAHMLKYMAERKKLPFEQKFLSGMYFSMCVVFHVAVIKLRQCDQLRKQLLKSSRRTTGVLREIPLNLYVFWLRRSGSSENSSDMSFTFSSLSYANLCSGLSSWFVQFLRQNVQLMPSWHVSTFKRAPILHFLRTQLYHSFKWNSG